MWQIMFNLKLVQVAQMMLRLKLIVMMKRCCLVPYNLLNPMRQIEIKGNLPMNILHRLQEAALEEESVMVTGRNLSLTRTLKIFKSCTSFLMLL